MSENLYQKLARIRKQVEVIQKNKSGYGYKYVTDDELLAKISTFMDKYKVSLIPSIAPGTLQVQPYTYQKTKRERDKNGDSVTYTENVNEVMVHGDMQYVWVDNEDPEQRVVVPWGLVGHQSDGSQSLGSALTYSMRYFLLKFFSIATPEDDPDNWRSKQHEAEAAEDRAIAGQLIHEFDNVMKSYISEHSDQTSNVREFVNKYVKSGDYFKITESAIASKLLSDFKQNFMNEGE